MFFWPGSDNGRARMTSAARSEASIAKGMTSESYAHLDFLISIPVCSKVFCGEAFAMLGKYRSGRLAGITCRAALFAELS